MTRLHFYLQGNYHNHFMDLDDKEIPPGWEWLRSLDTNLAGSYDKELSFVGGHLDFQLLTH